jgi:hypothetical protein
MGTVVPDIPLRFASQCFVPVSRLPSHALPPLLFFLSLHPCTPVCLKRPKPLIKEPERLATLDQARAAENSMRATLGQRYKDFAWTPSKREKLRAALDAKKMTAALLLTVACMLIFVSDKASPQFAMAQYLTSKVHSCCVWLWDPMCHGLYNASNYGLREAGYMALVLSTACITNYKAGLAHVMFAYMNVVLNVRFRRYA